MSAKSLKFMLRVIRGAAWNASGISRARSGRSFSTNYVDFIRIITKTCPPYRSPKLVDQHCQYCYPMTALRRDLPPQEHGIFGVIP